VGASRRGGGGAPLFGRSRSSDEAGDGPTGDWIGKDVLVMDAGAPRQGVVVLVTRSRSFADRPLGSDFYVDFGDNEGGWYAEVGIVLKPPPAREHAPSTYFDSTKGYPGEGHCYCCRRRWRSRALEQEAEELFSPREPVELKPTASEVKNRGLAAMRKPKTLFILCLMLLATLDPTMGFPGEGPPKKGKEHQAAPRDLWLQAPDRWLHVQVQIGGFKLQTDGLKIQIEDFKLQVDDYRFQIDGLRVAASTCSGARSTTPVHGAEDDYASRVTG
jgi:hypothetical protein